MVIQTVCDCCRRFGCTTYHPRVSLIDLEKLEMMEEALKFDFFVVLLVEARMDGYGWKYYDFSDATMVFLSPGEVLRIGETNALPKKGWLLAFHPDLFYRVSLKNHRSFFFYRNEEALHLSARETGTVKTCLENIRTELYHSIDTRTWTILSLHIELLLVHCERFYERQFITREDENRILLDKFDKSIETYLLSGKSRENDSLALRYFAEELGLSVAYFNDLLKFETGKAFSGYLQLKRLHIAKRMLREGERPVAEVARLLGFPNVQCFTVLFKKLVGVAPNRFRDSMN